MYVITGKELEQLLERVRESYSNGGSNFLSNIGNNEEKNITIFYDNVLKLVYFFENGSLKKCVEKLSCSDFKNRVDDLKKQGYEITLKGINMSDKKDDEEYVSFDDGWSALAKKYLKERIDKATLNGEKLSDEEKRLAKLYGIELPREEI